MRRYSVALFVAVFASAFAFRLTAATLTIGEMQAEAVDENDNGDKHARLLAPAWNSHAVPAGFEYGFVVLHFYDNSTPKGLLTAAQLEDYKVNVTVTKVGDKTDRGPSSVVTQWVEQGAGGVGYIPRGPKDERGFFLKDAIDDTSALLGEVIGVVAIVMDSNNAVVFTSSILYVERFYNLEWYSSPIPLPGVHLAAFNTYSYTPATNEASTDPVMLAWGGKVYISPRFYFGFSLAGFYTITPDATNPANSNLAQFCVAVMVDINNYFEFSPVAVVADLKNSKASYTILLSVDPGILQILRSPPAPPS